MADDPKKPYGDVEYADPEDGKYPIDTAEHCRAAWSYVNQAKNATVLGDKLNAVKARIKAACKKFGIEISESAGRALDDNDTIERRAVLMPVELRAIDGAEGSRTIGGYAAVFNRDSRLIPRMAGSDFVERVAPVFFEEARAAGWPGNQGSGVLCRWNHNDQYLLGTTQAGTTQLSVDRTGLEYRTDVPNCRDDVLEYIARGDCNRSSFTFMDAEDEWSYSGGVTHRTLISGGVLDVAPVSAVAAYQDTSVGLRSLAAHKDVPVDDVFALASQHELRKLFTRTDQALAPAEERTVATETPAEPPVQAAEQLALDVAGTETPAEPAEAPPLEWEPPATLGHREARLHLLSRRPHDPIIKVTPKGNITS
jgi:phage head maturation protease